MPGVIHNGNKLFVRRIYRSFLKATFNEFIPYKLRKTLLQVK